MTSEYLIYSSVPLSDMIGYLNSSPICHSYRHFPILCALKRLYPFFLNYIQPTFDIVYLYMATSCYALKYGNKLL